VLGYGGLWNIVDEAHISTIATHPDYRGRGWGEVLLAAMIRKSMLLQAAYIVLEVRVSNKAAQNLYHKYEFIISGVKTRYYQNNGEDAFDMRLDLLRDGYQAMFEQRYADLLARHEFVDQYTQTPHPHAQR
jgi:ribosomal-protein-alanine N-acetyltransferase